MSLIIYYFFIAVGLSMDAFSLSILYGINKKQILTALIVGIFHFIMPNLGVLLTSILSINFNKYTNIISGIIFLILAVEMIKSYKEDSKKYTLEKITTIILFAFAVSIDSFSIGIVLSLANEHTILASIVFALTSFIFTYIGLFFGKTLNDKVGNISKIIGILIIIILSVKYFLNI